MGMLVRPGHEPSPAASWSSECDWNGGGPAVGEAAAFRRGSDTRSGSGIGLGLGLGLVRSLDHVLVPGLVRFVSGAWWSGWRDGVR
jgi:hypothetical protein